MSKIFYIDPVSGNDETGDGTKDAPFATVQKALDNIIQPTTVRTIMTVYPGNPNTASKSVNAFFSLDANKETG